MKLLYERTETDDKITLVYPPYSMVALLIILLLLMAVTFVEQFSDYAHFSGPLTFAAAIVVFVRIVFMHKVNSEVQSAIRENKVTITGTKLSFTNPLTFVIDKKASNEEA
ncbi:hypothetical protein KJ365_12675 [Glaciecola sp. XM2]|jgi:hypothetical protein|uniref:hypothetical protein n=1 Tax=Glaciecola sp. XM2 TaxID=1914931 RepID=UPI001BDE3EBE|nr:hypothetical protein [Glaciecola sp. XM2]MBT1451738.1 hypothetical protein [Glaciecola sp. XM2]